VCCGNIELARCDFYLDHVNLPFLCLDESYLQGVWDGQMVEAYYYPAEGKEGNNGGKASGSLKRKSLHNLGKRTSYRYDPSSSTVISQSPLLPDPYETEYVEVLPSQIPGDYPARFCIQLDILTAKSYQNSLSGAGEGLFAKRDLLPNVVVSYYNGIRIHHDTVDSRLKVHLERSNYDEIIF
jgi:hypothetical protein